MNLPKLHLSKLFHSLEKKCSSKFYFRPDPWRGALNFKKRLYNSHYLKTKWKIYNNPFKPSKKYLIIPLMWMVSLSSSSDIVLFTLLLKYKFNNFEFQLLIVTLSLSIFSLLYKKKVRGFNNIFFVDLIFFKI